MNTTRRNTLHVRRTQSGSLRRGSLSLKRSNRALGRSVSFGEEFTKTVEVSTVDEEARSQIWYTKEELNSLQKREIRKNLIHQLQLAASEQQSERTHRYLESKQLPWRGLEGLQEEAERLERIHFYVHTVVSDYQQRATPSELKRLAKSLSKEERVKAQQMGLEDELQVHGVQKKDFTRRKSALGRSLSGFISWVKQNTSFRNKKESAQAA